MLFINMNYDPQQYSQQLRIKALPPRRGEARYPRQHLGGHQPNYSCAQVTELEAAAALVCIYGRTCIVPGRRQDKSRLQAAMCARWWWLEEEARQSYPQKNTRIELSPVLCGATQRLNI